VKNTLEERDKSETQILATVGAFATGDDCTSGQIRRYYTSSYKCLDQFDQLWYECCYDRREKSWETCYTWAVLLDCVINARSAYCELAESIEPLKAFIAALIPELYSYASRLDTL
jgi:hypothetical protein